MHSNHSTAPELHDVERSESVGLRQRVERGRALVAVVLRDHANAPIYRATSAAAT